MRLFQQPVSPALGFYSGQRIIIPFDSPAGPGYFADRYTGRDAADHPTVLEVGPYTELAWLQVRAWDIRLGATYEEVIALGIGGYGASQVFSAYGSNPWDSLALPAPLTGLQSFSLLPVVPEPSSATLWLFGALALVAFCRWSGK